MSINLEKYLGQEVQIELQNGDSYVGVVEEYGDSYVGVVEEWRDPWFIFRFKIGNAPEYYNACGYYNNSDCKEP
jgi:hypothetical protein